jgi:NAD(P)-dependent dehydrogenase (short-subunit alcohol dehydrogenase family)
MTSEMKGKYCLITGASSGIGKEIALGLAEKGASVVLVCRDRARGKAAQDYIREKSGNDLVDLFIADLSSQQQIRNLAKEYEGAYPKLHILVNNAGTGQDKRVLTADGVEMTFAVNYLAYFLLTNLLSGILKRSAPSRIVNIVSQIHRVLRLDLDNLQGEKIFSRDISYAQSKLADILFTYELARRLEGTGVTANCVCPGAVATQLWKTSSKFLDAVFKVCMKGPVEGAGLPLYLCTSTELEGVSCKYFQTRQHLKFSNVSVRNTMKESSRETYDLELARQLWEVSEKLTGLAASP